MTELSEAVSLLATNEFRPVHLERISARITVSDKLQRASLVQVVARQEYYSPGDEVVLEIVLRPFGKRFKSMRWCWKCPTIGRWV